MSNDRNAVVLGSLAATIETAREEGWKFNEGTNPAGDAEVWVILSTGTYGCVVASSLDWDTRKSSGSVVFWKLGENPDQRQA